MLDSPPAVKSCTCNQGRFTQYELRYKLMQTYSSNAFQSKAYHLHKKDHQSIQLTATESWANLYSIPAASIGTTTEFSHFLHPSAFVCMVLRPTTNDWVIGLKQSMLSASEEACKRWNCLWNLGRHPKCKSHQSCGPTENDSSIIKIWRVKFISCRVQGTLAKTQTETKLVA